MRFVDEATVGLVRFLREELEEAFDFLRSLEGVWEARVVFIF